jgi:predicted Zn-ribbon and HTH transcriptional regulator
MEAREQVIEVMKNSDVPMSASEVEKATGLDRKEVDKVFKVLKKEALITSPIRCKWEIAQD